MTQTDWLGFIGVTILLIAYFLNLFNLLHRDGLLYICLNLAGAGLACLASVFLQYLPFIILEGSWSIVSLVALLNYAWKSTKKAA